MFNNKILVSVSLILLATLIGSKYNEYMNKNDDYNMIKMYLLNDSPLYGSNKPKIWIHSKYEINPPTVSYTHLTLPTIYSVKISVHAVS